MSLISCSVGLKRYGCRGKFVRDAGIFCIVFFEKPCICGYVELDIWHEEENCSC